MRNKTNIEPKVPSSKPPPNNDMYGEEEKNDAIRNATGIAKAENTMRSFGIKNFPSKSLASSQKNTENATPTETRKPLLASNVTGIKGTKKKIDKKNVVIRE